MKLLLKTPAKLVRLLALVAVVTVPTAALAAEDCCDEGAPCCPNGPCCD